MNETNEPAVSKVEELIRNITWQRIKSSLPKTEAVPDFDLWVRKGLLGRNVQNCCINGPDFNWDFELGSDLKKELGATSNVFCIMSGALTYPNYFGDDFVRAILIELMTWKANSELWQRGERYAQDQLRAKLDQNCRDALLKKSNDTLERVIENLDRIYMEEILSSGRSV